MPETSPSVARKRKIARLPDLSSAVSVLVESEATLESALASLIKSAAKAAGIDGGYIGIFDSDSQTLRISAVWGLTDALIGREIPATDANLGGTIPSSEPRYLADLRELSTACSDWPVDPNINALAYALRTSEAPQGILVLSANHGEKIELTDRRESAIKSFTNLAALAIERIRLHDFLAQAQERAEVADRAKTAFLANMSHELRTPLTSILGYGELLSEPDFGDLNDAQKGFARTIFESGQLLLHLINNLLDLANVETGRSSIEPTSFDVAELVKECADLIKGLAARHSLKLDVMTDGVGEVMADVSKVKQVIYNLLTNACKFTDDGGSIKIKAVRGDGEIIVSVRDSGIGVPSDQLEAVFKPFFRMEGSDSDIHGGAGLGLALCRKFVRLHGGRIWAESEPGQGSCFTFTLPAESSSKQSFNDERRDSPTRAAARTAQRAKVLVIEDNPANIELICQILTVKGFEPIRASTGMEGIERAKRDRPDVVLLDINLPDVDGVTVLKVLKNDEETKNLPVAAVTAHAMRGDREHLLAEGCDAYISKPIDSTALIEQLSSLAAGAERVD